MTQDSLTYSTATPNVVVQNPTVRRFAGIIIGAAAIIVPAAMVLDASTVAFDWTGWTTPALAVTSFLAGIFQVSVSSPNVPRT